MPLAVVAVGGHAIAGFDGGGAAVELRTLMSNLAAMAGSGWQLVITHGNGPQVGELLMAGPHGQPLAALDVLDAETQGSLGYLLQRLLGNALRESGHPAPVAALLTQVVVDPADPAFVTPSKPVGPVYPAVEVERLRRGGWVLQDDPGRGWRRVVPSPRPLEIVEAPIVAALLDRGAVVIAAGGGGIPVLRESGSLRGIEAVIDKDRTSSLLARVLSADALIILTSISEVFVDFTRPTRRALRRLDVAEARRHLQEGQFAAGSMGPKVEAAADFAEATGRTAFITSPERLTEALAGEAGTRVGA